MKVQLVTTYRFSHLESYGVTVPGNVTSVYRPSDDGNRCQVTNSSGNSQRPSRSPGSCSCYKHHKAGIVHTGWRRRVPACNYRRGRGDTKNRLSASVCLSMAYWENNSSRYMCNWCRLGFLGFYWAQTFRLERRVSVFSLKGNDLIRILVLRGIWYLLDRASLIYII